MRDYEIVYIFRSSFTSEEIDAKLERYHALVTGKDGGAITAVEQWGKRQLAYPIEKELTGFYVVAQFTANPDALPEFERVLKLEDELLRYLIVLSEGELPIPPSVREEREAVVRRAEAEAARLERAEAQASAESTAESADGDETEGEPEADTGAEGEPDAEAEPEGEPDADAEAETPAESADETTDETEAEDSPGGDDDAGAEESAAEKEE
jgi:small subunit ribosomal protein S6